MYDLRLAHWKLWGWYFTKAIPREPKDPRALPGPLVLQCEKFFSGSFFRNLENEGRQNGFEK
jgi:hypothetical protein